MGANPTKAADNIYCQCRKKAARYNDRLHSREGAAEQLGYSPSTLAGWELGTDRPSPEAALLMSDLYHAPEIVNHYCREVCPLGHDIPKIDIDSLDRIAIKALSVFRHIEGAKEKLLDITEDGIITQDEQPELEHILNCLDEVTHIAMNLKAWVKKNLGNEEVTNGEEGKKRDY